MPHISTALRLAGLGAALLPLVGCSLPPETALTAGPAAQSPVTSYTALGDSITAGVALDSPSEAYPARIATVRGWSLANDAIPGDQACDIFPRQILPNAVAFQTSAGTTYSLLIGTNDADIKGTGNYEPLFSNCHLAALTWVATRPADKLFPGNTSVTASGSCTAQASDKAFTCSASGTLTATDLTTTGAAIYVWYSMNDASPATSSFTVAIDGKVEASASVLQAPAIATHNGSTSTIGVLRIPVAAGTHTLRLTTATGGITVLAFGTNRATAPIAVAVGDVPNQLLSNPVATVATQLEYTALVRANVALALADKLDVRIANDRDFMLGTAAEMNDSLHPSAYGQLHLARAFSAALP